MPDVRRRFGSRVGPLTRGQFGILRRWAASQSAQRRPLNTGPLERSRFRQAVNYFAIEIENLDRQHSIPKSPDRASEGIISPIGRSELVGVNRGMPWDAAEHRLSRRNGAGTADWRNIYEF
jgi:hypothetical protein